MKKKEIDWKVTGSTTGAVDFRKWLPQEEGQQAIDWKDSISITGDGTFKQWRPEQQKEEEVIGVKHSKEKPKLSILFKQFPNALKAIARCSEFGHEKYKETDQDYLNYSRVEGGSDNYADAGLRHRTETGVSEESGLPHYYHVAWNALAELELKLSENNVTEI